jgi:hypothetical protein
MNKKIIDGYGGGLQNECEDGYFFGDNLVNGFGNGDGYGDGFGGGYGYGTGDWNGDGDGEWGIRVKTKLKHISEI